MKKIYVREIVFEQVKALKGGIWQELCDNDVFFSEVVENILMEIVVQHKSYDQIEILKDELEDKIREYKKGGTPEWREKK